MTDRLSSDISHPAGWWGGRRLGGTVVSRSQPSRLLSKRHSAGNGSRSTTNSILFFMLSCLLVL